MACSRRHTPIISMTTTASEKQDKRWANRNHCAALRRALKRAADPHAAVLPALRDVSAPWAMAKDGRSWLGRYLPELMRKWGAGQTTAHLVGVAVSHSFAVTGPT